MTTPDHMPEFLSSLLASEAWMPPERAANQEFDLTFRGFDPDQVRSHLAACADTIAALLDWSRQHQENPYLSLGQEVASILQAARDAASGLERENRERSERLTEFEQSLAARQEALDLASHDLEEARRDFDSTHSSFEATRSEIEERSASLAALQEELASRETALAARLAHAEDMENSVAEERRLLAEEQASLAEHKSQTEASIASLAEEVRSMEKDRLDSASRLYSEAATYHDRLLTSARAAAEEEAERILEQARMRRDQMERSSAELNSRLQDALRHLGQVS